MQKGNPLRRALHWVEQKGFYMILGLCVVAIGVSAYVLFFTAPEQEPIIGELQSEPQTDVVSPAQDITVPENRTPQPLQQSHKLTEAEPEQQAKQETAVQPTEPESHEDTAPAVQVEEPVSVKEPVFTLPIQAGEIQREYSGDQLVLDATMGDWRTHNGVDFACDLGDAVMAVMDGVVSEIGEDAMQGHYLEIDHGAGLESRYCGLTTEDGLRVGMQVSVGQTIGRADAGNLSESAQESHVHLEMTEDGHYVDPLRILK